MTLSSAKTISSKLSFVSAVRLSVDVKSSDALTAPSVKIANSNTAIGNILFNFMFHHIFNINSIF